MKNSKMLRISLFTTHFEALITDQAGASMALSFSENSHPVTDLLYSSILRNADFLQIFLPEISSTMSRRMCH